MSSTAWWLVAAACLAALGMVVRAPRYRWSRRLRARLNLVVRPILRFLAAQSARIADLVLTISGAIAVLCGSLVVGAYSGFIGASDKCSVAAVASYYVGVGTKAALAFTVTAALAYAARVIGKPSYLERSASVQRVCLGMLPYPFLIGVLILLVHMPGFGGTDLHTVAVRVISRAHCLPEN